MTDRSPEDEPDRKEERLPRGPLRPHPRYGKRASKGGDDRWGLLVGCVLAVLAGILGAIAITTTTTIAGVLAALILLLALIAILQ